MGLPRRLGIEVPKVFDALTPSSATTAQSAAPDVHRAHMRDTEAKHPMLARVNASLVPGLPNRAGHLIERNAAGAALPVQNILGGLLRRAALTRGNRARRSPFDEAAGVQGEPAAQVPEARMPHGR